MTTEKKPTLKCPMCLGPAVHANNATGLECTEKCMQSADLGEKQKLVESYAARVGAFLQPHLPPGHVFTLVVDDGGMAASSYGSREEYTKALRAVADKVDAVAKGKRG